jgi:tetratricopeptide (TPR) repeat protein
MGYFIATFVQRFREWDRASQAGFGIALALWVVLGVVLVIGPADNLQQPALIGFVGLIIMMQVITMWANRGMVTPYTQAQRHYLAGELDEAAAVLEAERASGKLYVRSLTLLGNTYRQLGDLDSSEMVLREALTLQPDHNFPLYGFGRTLLVKGNYDEAVEVIQQALDANAPPLVHFDLGEALLYAGHVEAAVAALEGSLPALEDDADRLTMARYLLHQAGHGKQPDSESLNAALPYWQATATRFQQTPYGRSLGEVVRMMQAITEETL